MKTIAFLNIKGGVAKTTSVTTIGHMMATEYGKRVLLVDLDGQGNCTSTFVKRNFVDDFMSKKISKLENSVGDLLLDKNFDVHNCIRKTKYENLDIIGSDLNLIKVERAVNADIATPQQIRLQRHLQKVQDEYDYCLLDCGPNTGLVNGNGLTMADEVYVPMTADGYSLEGLIITEEFIENISEFNLKLKLGGIFFTRWERESSNMTAYELVKMVYPEQLIPIVVNKSKYCKENTFIREPLLSLDRGKNKSKATKAYMAITEYIMAPNKKEYLKTLELEGK